MDYDSVPGGYIYRPGTAPPVFRNNKVGHTYSIWVILGKFQAVGGGGMFLMG